MRKIIAALQVSLDGFIEGEDGQLDWIEDWDDCFGLMPTIDACLLGARTYPTYEEYWTAVLANPSAQLSLTGKPPTQGEVDYAHFARKTPHYVLSRSMHKLAWDNASILRDLDDVRQLKAAPGKSIHAVGGAALVSGLLNAGLLDEVVLVVHPVLLGAGKSLFEHLSARRKLYASGVEQLGGGRVKLSYSTREDAGFENNS